MYNKVECITLTCDNCGEVYQNDHSGFSIWITEGDAQESASNDDWYSADDDKHYCPGCHEINDDDELIIHPKKDQP